MRELAIALIALGGRHLDDATACVDVRLEGGIRVHAVLPPVSAGGNGRLHPRSRAGRADARRPRGGRHVRRCDACRAGGNGGATRQPPRHRRRGCGKDHAPRRAPRPGRTRAERIVTIEDVAELRIDHPHHVRLEARQPNLEGAGGIGLARLVREALRMRPDRLVLGECRGEEVRELLTALNTGHDGGAGTLHANGLHEVSARLEALGALAGMDDRALARQVVSAIGVVLHVARGRRWRAGVCRPSVGLRWTPPDASSSRRRTDGVAASVASAVAARTADAAADSLLRLAVLLQSGLAPRGAWELRGRGGRRGGGASPRGAAANGRGASRGDRRGGRCVARGRGGMDHRDDGRSSPRGLAARDRRRRCVTPKRLRTTPGSRSPNPPAPRA